jgi:predicted DCC family thiol-disulfide oxidoreductase YuxK
MAGTEVKRFAQPDEFQELPRLGLLRPVLLYDGTCKLCRWAARVVVRLDRDEGVALLPLDDEEAGRLLVCVPEDARFGRFWFVLHDGTPIAGDAGGGSALLAEVRLTRPVEHVLGAVHASAIVDALDKVIARHRQRLGHLVPEGDAPRRYP